MKAAIFVFHRKRIGFSFKSESVSFTAEAESAEKCLDILQGKVKELVGVAPTLTFRPLDGMIFCCDISATCPVGVLYQEGYNNGIRM